MSSAYGNGHPGKHTPFTEKTASSAEKTEKIAERSTGDTNTYGSKTQREESGKYRSSYRYDDMSGDGASTSAAACSNKLFNQRTEQLTDYILEYVRDELIKKALDYNARVMFLTETDPYSEPPSDGLVDDIVENVTEGLTQVVSDEIIEILLNDISSEMAEKLFEVASCTIGNVAGFTDSDEYTTVEEETTEERSENAPVDIENAIELISQQIMERTTSEIIFNAVVKVSPKVVDDAISDITKFMTEIIADELIEKIAENVWNSLSEDVTGKLADMITEHISNEIIFNLLSNDN